MSNEQSFFIILATTLFFPGIEDPTLTGIISKALENYINNSIYKYPMSYGGCLLYLG